MYTYAMIAMNIILGFVGYWVNSFALIGIFGDRGGYWGGGSPSEVIGGIVTLLLSNAFAVGINWYIYHSRQPEGKVLTKAFLLPLGIWCFAAVLVPLWYLFFW